MMDKRILVEYLKSIIGIQFSEHVIDDCIGVINDNTRCVDVLYNEDNIGQYLILSYGVKYEGSFDILKKHLSNWFVNGRYEICDNSVRLYSVIPVIDETYLCKQIVHALSEIWDMNNVVQSKNNQPK